MAKKKFEGFEKGGKVNEKERRKSLTDTVAGKMASFAWWWLQMSVKWALSKGKEGKQKKKSLKQIVMEGREKSHLKMEIMVFSTRLISRSILQLAYNAL